jgi:hypothetical protein
MTTATVGTCPLGYDHLELDPPERIELPCVALDGNRATRRSGSCQRCAAYPSEMVRDLVMKLDAVFLAGYAELVRRDLENER